MAGVRFTDVQSRPTEFLDFTSLTLDEFQQLVPPFEAAFQAHMAAWRLDGKPRTARRFTVYKNCPLPTPEDRLFFILTYLKTYASRWSRGACSAWARAKPISGSTSSCPRCWRRCAPSAMPPPAPSRPWPSGSASRRPTRPPWSRRWRRSLHPWPPHPAAAPASPLLPMTGRNGASSAPKTLLNRRTVIAARKKTTRSKMSCSSMPCSSSSFSATPTAAVSMISALPRPRPIPCRPGVGCCRIWASWRSRSPRWRSSCRRRNPAAQELTLEQQRANQALHQRRLRIEHVNSSVKRCRIVKDRIRLWKEGVRDLVMELCCALHNFRVRLTPWQPMI